MLPSGKVIHQGGGGRKEEQYVEFHDESFSIRSCSSRPLSLQSFPSFPFHRPQYKEKAFKRDRVDVLYLTQWVSIFQLLFGLGLAPLQALPGIGSAHGVPISSIPSSFQRSWQCFLQTPSSGCADQHPSPSLLLLGFCGINLVFNTAGLFISKHGSAILNVITYAVLLPITTLLFSLHPLMGTYTEPLRATTVAGLLVVVLGFYLYQEPVLDLEKRSMAEGGEEEAGEEEGEWVEEGKRAMGVRVPSFQERVVAGLGPATFQQPHGGREHPAHHHHDTTMAADSTAREGS